MAAPLRLLPRRPRQEDLEGVVLAGADLRALVMAGLDLSGRDLSGADLTGADLAGAKLQGAVLERAVLDDADLAGADLRDARLLGASLRRARGAGCVLAGARGAQVDLTGASLVGADLRGADLQGLLAAEALLQEVDARGAVLKGLSAPYVALDLARLDGADLSGADLRRATLEGASLEGACLDGANLEKARMARVRLQGARLVGARLVGTRLQRADVRDAVLDGVQARGLSDPGVVWSEAQLAALQAGGARVGPGLASKAAGAVWRWVVGGGPLRVLLAVATGIGWPMRALWSMLTAVGRALVTLRDEARERRQVRERAVAERRAALLQELRGDGALEPVSEAPLQPRGQRMLEERRRLGRSIQDLGARGLRGLLGAARSALGRGGADPNRERFVPGAQLAGMDLRGEDLAGVDLSGANLRGASLESADLRGAQLRGAVLDGARLNGARLDGANLEGASALETYFDEVSFEGASLVGMRAAGARLVRATFVGARFSGTSLVASDLTGASFADVDLADTNLSGALMEQADLAGARLVDAVVRGAELGSALGLASADLEMLRQKGADVGVFSAGLLSLRRLRELLPRLPGLTLSALRAAGSAPPALVRASARGLLGISRGLRGMARSTVNAAGALQAGGEGALGPWLAELLTWILSGIIRLPRTFVRAAERGSLELWRGVAYALRWPLVGLRLFVAAAARGVYEGQDRLGLSLAGSAELLGRLWRSQVQGVEWAIDVGLWRIVAVFAFVWRLALATTRATVRGVRDLARGGFAAIAAVMRLLDSGSAWLDTLGSTYDKRLDEAAARTEQLARTGARELRDLPSLSLRLARGTVGLLRRVLDGLRSIPAWLAAQVARARVAYESRPPRVVAPRPQRPVVAPKPSAKLVTPPRPSAKLVTLPGPSAKPTAPPKTHEKPDGPPRDPLRESAKVQFTALGRRLRGASGRAASAMARIAGASARVVASVKRWGTSIAGSVERWGASTAAVVERWGSSTDQLVDALQDGLVRAGVMLFGAFGRGVLGLVGLLRAAIEGGMAMLAPKRLSQRAAQGGSAVGGVFYGVLRGAGNVLDRASVAMEQAGETLRARAEERRAAAEERRAEGLRVEERHAAELTAAELTAAELTAAELTAAELTAAGLAAAGLAAAGLAAAELAAAQAGMTAADAEDFPTFTAPAATAIAELEAPTALAVEAPALQVDAPTEAEAPPESPEAPTSAQLIAEAELRPALEVDARPADRPIVLSEAPPDTESGRLAGLITLLAAALLSVYLGRQFLAVDNSANLEEEASEQLALGETDAALARYQKLLDDADRLDQRLSLRWQIATLLLQDSRREEALNQLRAAIVDARGEPDAEAEAWLKLGEGYRAVGGYDGELEACREALKIDGAPAALTARALVAILETYRRQSQVEQGDAEVADWLAKKTNPSEVLNIRAEMADLLVATGDYDRALLGLQSVSSLRLDRDQQARVFAEIASVHEARGSLRDALSTYEALIRDYPRNLGADGQVLLSAASVAWRLGFEDKATTWLDLLAQREAAPRVQAQATLLRARLERDAGRPNTAALLYQQVLRQHPDDRESTAAAQLALAETLWAVDDPESAERLYQELTRSGDAELVSQVRVGRGRVYQRRGELDSARQTYEAVLNDYPDSPAALAARAGLAELEIEAGNYNEAITALRELRAMGRGGLEVDAAIADALLRAGRMDEAQLAYGTLITSAEAGSEAALIGELGLARLAEINGNPEEARAGYERVINQSPDPVIAGQALEALANFYLDQGREDEAMVAYRDFLRTLPEGHAAIFDTRLAMAQILRRRGELDLAREHYEALLSESSTPARAAEVRVALAELEETRGDFAAAREAYTKLLAEESLPQAHRDDVVVGLVRTTLAAGDAARALELSQSWSGRTLETSTRDVLLDLEVQALRALGRGEEADARSGKPPESEDPLSIGLARASELVNEARYDEALVAYAELRSLAEDEASAASIELNIAQTLGTAGRVGEARVAYQLVIDRYPEEAEARFTAAMGLAWLDRLDGRIAAAIVQYQRLRGPDIDSEVWRLQQLAESWNESGDPGQAEEVYKQLIRAYPGHAGAQATGREGLASLLRSRGDLQAARALYEQVMRQAPEPRDRARARLNAAMILIDEGRPDAARVALEQVIEETDDPEILIQAHIGLSAVYLEQGSARQGLRVLDDVDAQELGAGWEATLLQQQTACLVEMGESAEAERRWRELMSDYPDDSELSAQARLALGDLAYGRDGWDEAIRSYDSVLTGSADRFYQARALLGKGQALAARGQAREAERAYAELLETYPEQGELVAIARAALQD